MYDYGFRIYDPRIGRFLSEDPLTKSYPQLTPYQFASNTPIWAIDIDGLEAYFTNTGVFVRWGPDRSKEASVIILQNKSDINGITLKNNSTDNTGKNITVSDFLKRAQRVYGESNGVLANYYAHAQDNKRKNNGGEEEDNYVNMENPNFDESSDLGGYKRWNETRGKGVANVEKLNQLNGADKSIAAVIDVLQGGPDPTKGADAWRGGINAQKTLIRGQSTKITLGWSIPKYIVNLTAFITSNGYHSFFSISDTQSSNKIDSATDLTKPANTSSTPSPSQGDDLHSP